MWVFPFMKAEIHTHTASPRSIAETFEPLLAPAQAALLLGIHPKTLVRMARAGEVPALRIRKHWRFRASLLNVYVSDRLQSDRQPVE
jgi:excisionase family DNA binding protein